MHGMLGFASDRGEIAVRQSKAINPAASSPGIKGPCGPSRDCALRTTPPEARWPGESGERFTWR
jgi:hypothetical protein